MLNSTKKIHNSLGTILFLCVIFNLIPVAIGGTVIPGLRGTGAYTLLVGLMFGVQTVLIIFYFLFNTQSKISKGLLVIFFLFIISQPLTLMIISLKGLHINNLDYLNIFVRIFTFGTLMLALSTLKVSKKGLYTFLKGVIILALIACIYNMVVNFQGIFNILSVKNPYDVNFKSFYINRNSFGQLLILGIISNVVIFLDSQKSKLLLLSFFLFSFNLLATFSRTALIILLLFTIIFVFFHYRSKLIIGFIMLIPVITFFTVFIINKSLNDFIFNILIREEAGIANRDDLWLLGIEVLNQNNWIFGVGYHTGIDLLNTKFNNTQFHNSYIEILVGGGIFELALHLTVIIITLKKVLNIIKKDRLVGHVFLSAFFSIAVYAFFESITFFSLGYVGSFFTIFFISLPWLYSNYLDDINNRKIVNII